MIDSCEQVLFNKARAGDSTAFDSLQNQLQVPVRRFLRRLIGRNVSAEDIMRDAFLALYMNLERIPSVESLRPFLFRVLRNLCYSELRRQGRFTVVSLDSTGATSSSVLRDVPDRRPSPHEQTERLLLHAEVQKAVERLPELQRQTLILYAEEDFSYLQIAEAMVTDIGTVKSRIY